MLIESNECLTKLINLISTNQLYLYVDNARMLITFAPQKKICVREVTAEN